MALLSSIMGKKKVETPKEKGDKGSNPDFVISSPQTFRKGIHVDSATVKGKAGPLSQKDLDELNGLKEDDVPETLRLNQPATAKPKEPARKKTVGTPRDGEFVISGPQGAMVHKIHVNDQWEWQGDDVAGHFKIVDKLGEGAYGAVYKAIAKEANFVLAIKMVLIGKDQTDLKKEIDILKKCSHPNIVRYYGSATRDNYLWIMMDFCGAGSLQDVMKKLRITFGEREIAYIMYHALRGLGYLHSNEHKIIHRDIKSGNILLTDEGVVKIADFGVSSQLNHTLTRTKTFVGTPLWMSPEVLEQEPYDQKADIWAMGITTIELADGSPPHADKHQMRAMFLIPQMPPPTVKQPEKWPQSFNDWLAKMLIKDPQERWSAESLITTEPYMLEAAKLGPEVLKETLAKLTAHKNAQLLGGSASGSASPSPQASPYNSDVKGDKEKEKEKAGESADAAPDTPGKSKDVKRDKRQSEFMITAPKFVGHAADPAGLDGIKQTILDLRNDLNKERAKSKALEDENAALREKNKKLRKKLKVASEDLDYAETDIKELEEKLEKLQGKLSKAEKKHPPRSTKVTKEDVESDDENKLVQSVFGNGSASDITSAPATPSPGSART